MASDNGPNQYKSILNTAELLHVLVPPNAPELYGDESDGGDEEQTGELTGHRQPLPYQGEGNVSANLYLPQQRRHMAEALQELIGRREGTLYGHVEFSVGSGEPDAANFDGAVYVFDTGNIAYLKVSHNIEDPVATAVKPSFDMARAMGLGDVWTESVFRYSGDESLQTQIYMAPLSDTQTATLNQTLYQFNQQSG